MGRLASVAAFHGQLLGSGRREPHWLDGWGSAEGQVARFGALVRSAGYRGGSVVDYGCGTGALREYLDGLGYPFTYLGVDMNPELLAVARRLTGSGEFHLIEPDTVDFPPTDYVFASGIFQFADPAEPLYHHRLAAALFGRCRIALSVNFLSAGRDGAARDPDELYVSPEEAVGLASSLSGKWVLDHSYHPARGDLTVSVHA
jgi:SAM-dependent methyltransferase